MSNLQLLMDDIAEWSDKTFGKKTKSQSKLYHLLKEVKELIEALDNFDKSKNGSEYFKYRYEVKEEFADCVMLLIDAARKAGISADEVIALTRQKLIINKERKWGEPDENGVVEHIKKEKWE